MNKKFFLVMLVLVVCAFGLSAKELVFQQGLNGYKGVSDVTLNGYDAAASALNWGGATELYVYGLKNSSGAKHFALIRFDDIFGSEKNQIPEKAKIKKATLYLYKVGIPNSWSTGIHFSIVAHPMLTSWKEGAMMGAKQEGTATLFYRSYSYRNPIFWGEDNKEEEGPVADIDYDTGIYATTAVDLSEKEGWMTWDVTEMVEEWQSGALENHGIILMSTSWWEGVQFCSSEYLLDKSLRPKLVVELR